MRRVIFNQKGGVGKSSIAVNLAAIGANRGLKTLVVDLDPQCNASQYLLGPAFGTLEGDIGDFFEETLAFKFAPKPARDYVHPTRFDNLALLPASPQLAELASRLESRHKIYKLREALEALSRDYERIYIDTPPAFNFYTLSALIAADACLIPFDCDDFSRRALYSLLDNLRETQADHNAALRVEGIVVNQFLAQARLPRQLVDELRGEGLPIMQTRLSSSVKMRESHQQALPLVHLAPSHKLTRQYLELHDELHASAA